MATLVFSWITFSFFIISCNGGFTNSICPQLFGCDCSTYKPNSTLLSISCNSNSLPEVTSVLPDNTAEFIYFAQEMEVQLGSTNFSHLPEMRRFVIGAADTNIYRTVIANISKKVSIFEPLKKLEHLSINIKWQLDKPVPQLFSPLNKLVELDLSYTREINIPALIESLYGFQNNTQLQFLNLWNIQTMEFAIERHLDLSALLEPLKKCPLMSLNIGYNAFEVLYPGLNMCAPSLKYFYAHNNLLIHLVKGGLLFDIWMHPTLVNVSLQYQGFGYKRIQSQTYIRRHPHQKANGTVHHSKILTDIKTVQPKSRHAMRQFSFHHSSALEPHLDECFNLLKDIKNRWCGIFSKECDDIRTQMNQSHSTMCNIFYRNPYLSKYFRGIPCHVIPPFHEVFQEECASCFVIPSTGSIKRIHFYNLNIYDEVYANPIFNNCCFHKNNSIEFIDISSNRVHGYADAANMLAINITGLDKLKTFIIAENGINTLNSQLGKNFPKLMKLDVSNNEISLNNSLYKNIFNGSHYLEDLQMSTNHIEHIPKLSLSWLHKLKKLNLSHNRIKKFDVSLSNLSQLRLLDLSYNLITRLPVSLWNDLDSIASKNKKSTLEIDLSSNDLVCTCQTKKFLTWALKTKCPNIVFVNPSRTLCINQHSNWVQLRSVKLTDIEHECMGNILTVALTIGITIPVSLLLFAGLVYAYRKRWWLRYQVFLGQQIWRSYKHQDSFHTPYLYDVFVSYNQKDQEWVDEVLQPMLEDVHNLNLCLHLRDFRLGEVITEQIITSIENSRKTLLILSPNFLASTWCQFEMQMAQHKLFTAGEDVLLLVLLNPLPKVGVSKVLKSLMEQKTYIEWSEDEYGQKLFWAKLLEAIKAPREEAFDLHYPQIEGDDDYDADENTHLLLD